MVQIRIQQSINRVVYRIETIVDDQSVFHPSARQNGEAVSDHLVLSTLYDPDTWVKGL